MNQPLLQAVPKAVSGEFVAGQLVLTSEDESTYRVPGVIIIRATLVDNGDSTFNLIFPEE